ncbi:hypothetical protein ACO22_07937, partial [Paracoccidioides brasiliensis]
EKNPVKEKLGYASLEDVDAQGPPPGYVFVPKGDVYITRNCRSRSRETKQMVYTVYNPQTRRTLDLDAPSQTHATITQSASSTLAARTTSSPKRTHETSRRPALSSALNSQPCVQIHWRRCWAMRFCRAHGAWRGVARYKMR